MTPDNSSPKPKQFRLNIRLSRHEWDKVHKLAANTTCRSTSEYARKVLAEQPVKVFYRNKSFDEFEEKMTILLSQLETFGADFSQLVKKLTAIAAVPEVRVILPIVLERGRDFATNMETIKKHIEKLSDQCDPK